MKQIEKLRNTLQISEQFEQLLTQNEFLEGEEFNETRESVKETIEKLSNKRYTVAVIAAMKAGKSTLFNSLLGRDLLPNETAACTAAITEINHATAPSKVIKKIMKDGKEHSIVASSTETIEEAFHRDVRESRSNNSANAIEKYFVESPILALQNESYKGLVENFILIDTPGPNEADTENFDATVLKEITYYQLRNADAIIFIFDYQVYKSDTNAKLLKEIFAGREDIKRDNEKIFFVLNKIDARTSKDGSKEDIIDNVRAMIRHQTEGIISNPQVLPVSALMALYGRQILQNNITDEALFDCKTKYQSRYAEEIIIQGEKYVKAVEGEKLGNHLVVDSDIQQIEKEVIINTFNRASEKIVEGALNNLQFKMDFIRQRAQSTIDIQSKGIEELRSGIQTSKEEVNKLEEFAQSIAKQTNDKVSIFLNSIQMQTANLPGELSAEVNKVLSNYQDSYESQDSYYISQIGERIQTDCQYAVSNYTLRKKDELIRAYNAFENELTRDLYDQFNDLSKQADTIIRKNLNVDIQTAGYLGHVEDTNSSLRVTVTPNTVALDSPQSDKDFYSQTMRGATGAVTGAKIGAKIAGPVGAVVGGVAGFLFGIGTYENRHTPRERETYTIHVSDIKSELRRHYEQQAHVMLEKFNEYFKNNTDYIDQSITKNIREFTAMVHQYLDNLEEEYDNKKDEREQFVKALESLNGEIQALEQKIQQLTTHKKQLV